MNRQLAKITSLKLSYQDRYILMLNLDVDYESGCSQNIFGGLVLDEPIIGDDGKFSHRQGTSFGCEMIRLILDVLKINDLSEGKGKYIHVLGEGGGFDFKPKGLETLRVDGDQKKIIFSEVLIQMTNKEGK